MFKFKESIPHNFFSGAACKFSCGRLTYGERFWHLKVRLVENIWTWKPDKASCWNYHSGPSFGLW